MMKNSTYGLNDNNKGEKNMKTNKLLGMSALVAIVALALISCSDGGGNNSPPPPPQEQPTERTTGTTKDLSFGTNCKVTIKGVAGEKYLNAEWTALCDKVVAAIMRGYDKFKDVGGLDDSDNKLDFATEFRSAKEFKIILSSSAAHNCEVKDGDYKTIYLKTSVLDTVDIQPAVEALANSRAYHQP
jgi:hypothetical protein